MLLLLKMIEMFVPFGPRYICTGTLAINLNTFSLTTLSNNFACARSAIYLTTFTIAVITTLIDLNFPGDLPPVNCFPPFPR
ncbi:hypothetical protein CLU79DRAFT_834848 [Phycomyces nitens]|nr:hypothetical protein CLU79DRAFT_834848 [Phycomyces nitens]